MPRPITSALILTPTLGWPGLQPYHSRYLTRHPRGNTAPSTVGKAVPFAWTFTPIDVGIAVGIFAKHGLELEVTGFAGDARVQQGLVSDSIDFGLGSGAGMG